MNILHIFSNIETLGGTPLKVQLLASKSRHKHFIYCLNIKDSDYYGKIKIRLKSKNVTVIDSIGNAGLIRKIFHIISQAKEHEISIINTYFPFDTLIASFVKLYYPRVKLVRSFVGYVEEKNRLRKFMLNILFRRFNNFIYISNYIFKRYTSQYPFLKKANNTIIYNCAVQTDRNKLDNISRTNLVCISGLNKHKNVAHLIHVMHILNSHYKKPYHLQILGDGPLRPEIELLINEYQLNDSVEILGYKEDVCSYLSACFLYLHPATNEGFGISVVEAMSMQCPVILADAGGLPELIEDGISGILAKPDDANDWAERIIKLAEDEKLRETIAKNGYERAITNFSEERFVKQHDQLYSGLIVNFK